MTAPGGDSGENPRGHAQQSWADTGASTPPDQGAWPYPPGFEGYPPPPPPNYGAPYPGNYFTPGQAQKTNVLAVSSLVLALLGLVFWPLAVAGVVLGGIALSQIKSTGEAGHGQTVAGTAIGGVAIALAFIVAVVALN